MQKHFIDLCGDTERSFEADIFNLKWKYIERDREERSSTKCKIHFSNKTEKEENMKDTKEIFQHKTSHDT